MKKNAAIVFTTLFLAVTAASADTETRAMSFDDIRTACLNPAKFHNQVAPSNIKVSCRDIQAKWIPDTEGAVKMNTGRQVLVSVQSDKYTSGVEQGTLPTTAQVASCPKYKQVLETVETIRAVSCEDLVAFNGPAIEFCAGTVNSLKAANPAAATIQETGEFMDLCAGVSGHKQLEVYQKDGRAQTDGRAQSDGRAQQDDLSRRF
jgi:hypothetical protein